MGTNLALSAEADARLEELTEERLVPIAGTEPQARLLEHKLNLDAARIVEHVERDLLEHLRGLPPSRFEDLCALYLRVLGCDDVEVVGAAAAGTLGDQGIDVIGTLARPGLPAVRLAVQAKRVAGGVGPSVVTQLRGSIPPGAYGVIITTGHFTRAAIAEAARADHNKSSWSTARNWLRSWSRAESASRARPLRCPGWTLRPSTTGLTPSKADLTVSHVMRRGSGERERRLRAVFGGAQVTKRLVTRSYPHVRLLSR
jgi:hypothetical protein